jgi:hypothetical protein
MMGDGMPSSPLSSLFFFFLSSLGARHKRVMAARGWEDVASRVREV